MTQIITLNPLWASDINANIIKINVDILDYAQ
jgi:hypothetical protein